MAEPIIALVNPNTNSAISEQMAAVALSAAGGVLRFKIITARTGSPLITNEQQLAAASDAVLALVPELQDVDGVIVAAFGDPALAELSAVLPLPVVGIGDASYAEASRLGRRFCVVTTTPDLAVSIDRAVADRGLQPIFGGVVLTPRTDTARGGEQRDRDLSDAIDRAVNERQAETVIIGGGPLVDVHHTGRGHPCATIVEPVPAAVKRMALLVEQARDKERRRCR